MVALTPVRDEFRMPRTRAAVIVIAIAMVLAIPSALSFTSVGLSVGGKPFLDVMDQVTGSGVVLVAGMAGAALIAWRLPVEQLLGSTNTSIRNRWFILVGRYLLLAAAALLLLTWLL